MWSCRNCITPAKGCCGAVALGGLSISLQPSFPSDALGFSATQVTAEGIISSSWTISSESGGSGVFSTSTYMHPTLNVIVTELLWNATGAGIPGTLTLNVSTWVRGANAQAHAGPMPTFAGCLKPPASGPIACPSQGNTSGVIAVASRAASNITVLGPRPVWVGIATAAIPASAATSYVSSGGSGDWGATALLLVPSGPEPIYLVTAEAESPSYAGADPAIEAATLASAWADADGPQSVAKASKAWWSAFWSRSSVVIGENTTNTLPEAMWWGAQVRHWIGVFVRVRVRVHS